MSESGQEPIAQTARAARELRPTMGGRCLQISARRQASLRDALWPVIGVLGSFVFLAPLLAIADAPVGTGYRNMISASFGDTIGLGFLFLASVPLILVSIGVAIPFRAGLFNIGGEGQLLIGAFTAVVVATKFASASGSSLSFLLPLACSIPSGAALGALAGVLRAWRGINEIVTTIMLSFVALYFVQYFINGPLQEANLSYPATAQVPIGYRLSSLGKNGLVPVGIIIAVIALVVAWWLVAFTRMGWRHRLIGLNPALAARKGVRVGREQVLAMGLGGGFAGLGGAAEALGNQFRVGLGFSPGWGFYAVAVAMLARGNMLAVLPFALYFGVLRNGSLVLQTNLQVPPELVLVLAGAPVIFVASVVGYRGYRRAIAEPPDD